MRRLALMLVVAGALIAPATPALAHAGEVAQSSSYRTRVTGVTLGGDGVRVRMVEGGTRLELTNTTGREVEVLGYAGEPYLAVRPDGTYENVNSPAAYLNETLGFDAALPASADPTAPPTWRKLSASTTVRWHDSRTQWMSPAKPADPGRARHLQNWQVPLRVQVEMFAITGSLAWEPPPPAWLWWLGAALTAAATWWTASRRVRPVALIIGLSPLLYAGSTVLDGGALPLVVVAAGLLGLGLLVRHPPFYLALAGAAVTLFGGFGEAAVFGSAVLPAAGPGWFARGCVMVALGGGAGLALTGVLRLRAALPAPAPAPASA